MRAVIVAILLILPSFALAHDRQQSEIDANAAAIESLSSRVDVLHPVEPPPIPNVPPVAGFSYSCVNLSCAFSDASIDPDGTVSVWSWDFGDGNIATSQSPSHSYAAAGSYSVGLTVVDDGGASDSTAQSVTVGSGPPPGTIPPPIAALPPGEGMIYGRPWADVAPDPNLCRQSFENVMTAWNGWTRDGLRYVWMAANGGHTNGCDNGIYRYDIQAGRAELFEPHLDLNAGLDTNRPYVADANGTQIRPRSSHTKEGVFYQAPYIYLATGSIWIDGNTDNQVWRYHTIDRAWEQLPNRERADGRRIGDTGAFLVPLPNGEVWLFGFDRFSCLTDLVAGTYDCADTRGHQYGNKSSFAYDPRLDGIWHYDIQYDGSPVFNLLRNNGSGKWVPDPALQASPPPVEIGGFPGICVVPDGNGGSKPILWGTGANLHQWDGMAWATVTPEGWSGADSNRRVLSKWSWDAASGTCIGGVTTTEGLRVYRPVDVPPVDPPVDPPGDGAFEARCADPAVIFCDPLDSGRASGVAIDAATPNATLPEALAGRYGDWRRVITRAGQPPPAVDTSIKASGDGSLRFTLPAQGSSDGSGAFQTNFTPDGSVKFGEHGGTFYVQWRYRMTCSILFVDCDPSSPTYKQERVNFPTPKNAIVNDGDGPEAPGNLNHIASSCSDHEIVFVASLGRDRDRGATTGYHSCGWFQSFEQSGIADNGGTIWNRQPGGVNQCWMQDPVTGRNLTETWPDCRQIWPDEWMTFEMAVTVGSWAGTSTGPPSDSHIKLWMAREDAAPELIIDHDFNIRASPDEWREYGKVWLTPYMTGRSPEDTWPAGAIWYDELIVSREFIAFPMEDENG